MRFKRFLYCFVLIILLVILIFSIYNIFIWFFNYKTEISELQLISNQKSFYNFLEVDFDELLSINPHTVAWIKIPSTNIDYPIVQASDNNYYLNHSFYDKYNPAGWVFLDYRNNCNFEDKNSIIYGHSQNNKTMFGTLQNVFDNDWVSNSNNHIIQISTPSENSVWQIFSFYVIPTTNDYIQIDFDNDFSDFIQMLIERSNFNFGYDVNENDRIITLSTCFNKNDKLVLHAKLLDSQKR